jgi:hypothetical protein
LAGRNTRPVPTTQVLWMRHLGGRVLSSVVHSCPAFGHRFGHRCPGRNTPPPMLHGRRLCKRLVLAAGSHIGQNVRVRGASRTRTRPRGASRKIYKYRRTEHRGLGLATQQAPRSARSPSPPGRAPRLGRNRPLPGPPEPCRWAWAATPSGSTGEDAHQIGGRPGCFHARCGGTRAQL